MRIPSRAAVFTAFVSGQLAGLAMLGSAMVLATLRGLSPLRPLQVFTALIVGEAPLHRVSASALLPGFLAHQSGPTLLWSRLFGLLVGLRRRPLSEKHAVLLGATIGALALFVVNGHNVWAENVPVWVACLTHLAYGTSMGFFYWRWQPPPA